MIESLDFVFKALLHNPHLYRVSMDFNLSISKLAIHIETRGDVLIDFFSVRFFCVKGGFDRVFCWLENCFKVCIYDERHLELVWPIVKLHE